jgi:hypothetical protein
LINNPQTTPQRRRERAWQERHNPCEVMTEAGATSRNVTVQADFVLDRPEQMAEESPVPDQAPGCVALVPVIAAAHRSRVPDPRLSRADFLTQLIATAEQVPQTRSLRRGTSADAKAAYAASWRHVAVQRAGIRTRQIV